jgi:hypothetical protein
MTETLHEDVHVLLSAWLVGESPDNHVREISEEFSVMTFHPARHPSHRKVIYPRKLSLHWGRSRRLKADTGERVRTVVCAYSSLRVPIISWNSPLLFLSDQTWTITITAILPHLRIECSRYSCKQHIFTNFLWNVSHGASLPTSLDSQ